MELMRVGGGIGYVILILVLALAAGISEGNRWTLKTLFGNGYQWWSPEAEQVWLHCWEKVMDRTGVVDDCDFYRPREETKNFQSILLTKISIHTAVRVMPSHMKQTVLDCLRTKNLLFHEFFKEASSNSWFIKHLDLLFDLPDPPRRYLVDRPSKERAKKESARQMAPSPGPAFSPGPAVASPNNSPTPSYSPPFSSPSPSTKSPVEAPEQTFLPPDAIDSLPLSVGKHNPPSRNFSPKQHENSKKETIIAVVATATGMILLVALFLICCCKGKKNKIDPKYRQRDDRPLLNLSSSNFSGSSQNSSLGNFSNKELNSNSGKTTSYVNNVQSVSGNCDSSLSKPPTSEVVAPVPPPPIHRGNPQSQGPTPPPPPGPPPPPLPKVVRPPPIPPKAGPGKLKPSPLGPHRGNTSEGDESESQKTKLKPFFWDKVLANPDHSMVWHEINSGSFVVDEEMMESLFGYTTVNKRSGVKKESSSLEPSVQYIQIIDTRKAQNLSILLRAHNVTTEEVCDALQEGNELPVELVQTLLKMAPTTEEELKLRLFTGDISQLGPAERFLKVLVDIPFAFKRLESLLFMSSVKEEVDCAKESFATLEVACNKLRSSRLFLKLLEAVLKTGNRMNVGTYRGGAKAFKLDTLLKLSDVKGTDGKTTLLLFVVQEIIRSEGIRAVRTTKASQSISSVKSEDLVEDSTHESEEQYRNLGLQAVSGVTNELEYVKKAAIIDADGLASTISKLGSSMRKTRDFLDNELKSMDENSEFYFKLANFVERIEGDITGLLEEEKRIMALVKSTADYFHGNAGKDEGLRLFAIVRDFLRMLDKACKEVRHTAIKPAKNLKKESSTPSASPDVQYPPSDIRQRLFPQIKDRRMDDDSSDDDTESP